MTLHLLLIEAGIEILPAPVKRLLAQKQKKAIPSRQSKLLDVAEHGFAMKTLPAKEKRGRPDILHHCLLNALDTPIAKTQELRVFFHAREGSVYEIAATTRISRNYNRFCGVIASLIQKHHVPETPPYLLWEVAKSLEQFLLRQHPPWCMYCTRSGQEMLTPTLFQTLDEGSSEGGV